MADHSVINTDFYGINLIWAIASFVGNILCLTYIKELKPKQIVVAVITGLACAGFVTPAAMQTLIHFYPWTASLIFGNFVAFIIGIVAMNIIPAIITISQKFKEDPFFWTQFFPWGKK